MVRGIFRSPISAHWYYNKLGQEEERDIFRVWDLVWVMVWFRVKV